MRFAIVALFVLATAAAAQSGGSYAITQSVVAGGGSQELAGGPYVVAGTTGQSAAGSESTGGPYKVRGGFWAEIPLGPTAAHVSFSGRVISERRTGIRRIRVTAMNLSTGVVKSTMPNSLGYFRFDDLEIGTYLINLEGRNLQFSPNAVVVSLLDSVSNFEITATYLR